jgi:glycosyltransferase involved in cell wall biosynthesis
MKDQVSNDPVSFLLICHSYPPVIGGSELEAQRTCAALIRRGHRVTVVCSGGPPMPDLRDWIDPEGVPVRIYASRWRGTLNNIVFALRIAGLLIYNYRKYQFVYFLMQGLHLAVGLPVARLLNKPIVMKIGGSGVVPLMAKSPTGRLELRWLRRWAYRIMILNEGMRQEAEDYGIPPRQLHWMPNPVDTDHFAPCNTEKERSELRRQFQISSTAGVVLYCGRLAPEKALPSLLDAFAIVARTFPEAVLVLVGDGVLRPELTRQAKRLNLDAGRIRFIGQVAPAEVCQWLKVADMFCLVSFSEGFACALAEAMSTGLPSVVSDIPANRQLIDGGQHGFLTVVNDSRSISSAVLQLLESDSLRSRMGKAARQRILDCYSTDKVVDRYESLFRQMLSADR